MNNDELVKLYLDSLSIEEKSGYEIAKKQLGTSFSLEKSIGFIDFLKNRPPKKIIIENENIIKPPKPPSEK